MSEVLSILKQDKRSTRRPTSETGERGERLAAQFLEAHGYQLVLSNFKAPIGRNSRGVAVTGEIDIVAVEGDVLCFIEVKSRVSDDFAPPSATVNLRKQRQIIRTAKVYRRVFGLQQMTYRYDVVSVILPANADPRVELLKDFWKEGQFRKRRWSRDIY